MRTPSAPRPNAAVPVALSATGRSRCRSGPAGADGPCSLPLPSVLCLRQSGICPAAAARRKGSAAHRPLFIKNTNTNGVPACRRGGWEAICQ
ncbi:hypothetical protein HMPREF0262_02726 [Clostridium sp. ATCC 29733]|nr:hypothetical protein HMPREF0262_02726 [Clostridium sp. ATCC 29733]